MIQAIPPRRPRRVDRSGWASRQRVCSTVRWSTAAGSAFWRGWRLSWQQAIRVAHPAVYASPRPVRASRENLMPSTMPTRPIVTSVTSRAKTAQGIGRRGRYPRVVVDHHDPRQRPAQRHRPLGQRVLQPRRFGMLKNLLPARLVHHRGPVPVLGSDLLLRLAPRPVPSQAYRARPPAARAANFSSRALLAQWVRLLRALCTAG